MHARRYVTAAPPDVRRRLCLAVAAIVTNGLCPWFGLRPVHTLGQNPQGQNEFARSNKLPLGRDTVVLTLTKNLMDFV